MGRAEQTRDGLFWKRVDERTGKVGRTWQTSLGGERVSTGCTSIDAARAWRARAEREAVDPTHKTARETTIATGIERFLSEITAAGRATDTLRFYQQKLGIFLTYYGEGASLADITPSSLVDFVKWRTTERRLDDGAITIPVDLTTVRKEIESLLTMLRSARHRREFPGDVDALKPLRLDAKYVPREKYPTPEVFARIVAELERRGLAHRAAWICAAAATGGRLGEVNRLRVEDLDFGAGVFRIKVTKTKRTEGRIRERPIPPWGRELLEYAIEHGRGVDGALVESWKPANLKQTIERVCAELGVGESYTSNDFRRALASWLTQGGVAPNIVAYMLGHTSTSMVERVYGRMKPAAAGRLIDAAMRTESVPITTVQGGSQPMLSSGKPAENAGFSTETTGAEGILIPLIGVRIPAPEQAFSESEPPSKTVPVPETYQPPTFSTNIDGNDADVTGVALARAVAPALTSDRPGVALAIATAALAADEIDSDQAEAFVAAVLGDES